MQEGGGGLLTEETSVRLLDKVTHQEKAVERKGKSQNNNKCQSYCRHATPEPYR